MEAWKTTIAVRLVACSAMASACSRWQVQMNQAPAPSAVRP